MPGSNVASEVRRSVSSPLPLEPYAAAFGSETSRSQRAFGYPNGAKNPSSTTLT